MPQNEDYFYDRYFRKKYDYIPPDQEIMDTENEMMQYLTPQEEEVRPVNPLSGLGRAMGVTTPGGGGMAQLMKMLRSNPNMPQRESTPPLPMMGMPNPEMRMGPDLQPPIDAINDLIQEAEYNFRNNDYDQAASILDRAKLLNPNHPQIQKLSSAISKGKQNKFLTQRYQQADPLMQSIEGLFSDENSLNRLLEGL